MTLGLPFMFPLLKKRQKDFNRRVRGEEPEIAEKKVTASRSLTLKMIFSALSAKPLRPLRLRALVRSQYARPDQRLENLHSIRAAKRWFACPLRMRHHPEHISSWAADARYIIQRSVRVRLRRDLSRFIAIAEHNPVIAPQFREGRFIAKVV